MNQMITVLIPTMNRSEFLIRLLQYYRDLRFQGWICIGDSSNAYHVERTKSAIKSLEGKLKVTYYGHPNLKYNVCFKELGESVSTPYTVLLGDDEFLVPNGLEQCIGFLESERDYSAAHGVGATFSLNSSGPYGKLSWVGRYPQRAIKGERASQRLIDHLTEPFVPLHSVHRTEAWRVMCRDVTLPMHRSIADETLPSCLSVIQGKIKELDCFYLAFQHHDQRTRHPDIFDSITDPVWTSSYQIFRESLAAELARLDGISVEEAREVVRQGFWSLLARALMKKWEARYAPRTPDSATRFHNAARRIPGLRSGWRAVRSLLRRREHAISLPALLRPSSPYHADFMPIYRAVTNPQTDLPEGADVVEHLGATVASRRSTISG